MDFSSLVKQLMMMGGGGNIPLNNRPQVPVGGGTATVRSMGITDDTGNVVIPTIRPDGWAMSPKQAIDQYRKTGQQLGRFKTQEEADKYAELLHRQQAEFYGR